MGCPAIKACLTLLAVGLLGLSACSGPSTDLPASTVPAPATREATTVPGPWTPPIPREIRNPSPSPPASAPSSARPSSFTFAVAVDMRIYAGRGSYDTPAFFRGAAEAIQALGGAAFVISPGDIDPPSGVKWTIDRVLGPNTPWYPAVGNHEAETSSDMDWLRRYNYDPNGPGTPPDIVRWGPKGCPTTTYSFDYENAHFAVLNVYCGENGDTATDGDIPDHLYNWLAEDLAATDKTHLFVVGHEPAYVQRDADNGRQRHLGDSLDRYPANRDRFWSLLQREGVVAYITGHTHNYSAEQIEGVWQLDAGHARGAGDTGAPSTFVLVHVDGDSVTFDSHRDVHDGVYDYDDVVHQGTLRAPSPTPTSFPVPAATETPTRKP